MKAITVLFIFILNMHLLFLGFSFDTGEPLLEVQDLQVSKYNTPNPQETGDIQDQDNQILDPEYYLRKLDQQKLPPLDKKGEIIWSFRMSQPDLFL